jgi:hypothetical protein
VTSLRQWRVDGTKPPHDESCGGCSKRKFGAASVDPHGELDVLGKGRELHNFEIILTSVFAGQYRF